MDRVEIARQRLALVAWCVSLLLGIAVFTWLGRGPLASPPLSRPEAWSPWLDGTDPVDAAFALGRLLVLALAWYLAGSTVLGTLARACRRVRLVRLADAVTLPLVRRVLDASLGLGLATAVVAAGAPVSTRTPRADAAGTGVIAVAVRHRLPADDLPVPLVLLGEREDRSRATDRRHARGPVPPVADPLWHLRSRDPGTPDDPRHARPGAPPDPATDPAEQAPPGILPDHAQRPPDPATDPAAVEGTWEVRAGDHFWSIAERVVAQHLGRAPNDAATARYWRRLVDANRDRLAHPGDPDLIHPGQRFVLPPMAADTRR